MCGISGFNWLDVNKIKLMNDMIKFRGPDDQGFSCMNGLSLGHVRLSILDLTDSGYQPMFYSKREGACSEKFNKKDIKLSKISITFNGEIYNFKEIKSILSKLGYKFNTSSDTEVILASYLEWGYDCVNKFNGMWAFCIYDSEKEVLFCSRDRFGQKPFYYILDNERFIFSSEMKNLLSFLDEKIISQEGLKQFFNLRFSVGDETILEGIKKLSPAHNLVYDLKEKKIKSHYKFYTIKKKILVDKGLFFYKKRLNNLLKKSIKRRMVSDVPVASFLSGGIDSSIITCLAKEHNHNLNTFSVGFDTTNELPFAKIVAEKFNTNHHEIEINKDNVLKYLEDMIWHMDEPVGDPGFLPIFLLSKETVKFNKVVLSGDVSDEIFCGYDRYKMYHYGSFINKLIISDFGNDILKRLKLMVGKDDCEGFFEIIRLFNQNELKKLGLESISVKNFWSNDYKKKVFNAQRFDIDTLLPNDFFMKADKMSSAFGLEQRTPFVDHELVEFAFSIPLKYKLKIWNEKYILKKSFEGVLPSEIIKRKKHGFNVPIDYWFKGILGEKLRYYLRKKDHKLYNKAFVIDLLNRLKSSGKNYKLNFILSQKLWSVLIFEMWYERYIFKNECL